MYASRRCTWQPGSIRGFALEPCASSLWSPSAPLYGVALASVSSMPLAKGKLYQSTLSFNINFTIQLLHIYNEIPLKIIRTSSIGLHFHNLPGIPVDFWWHLCYTFIKAFAQICACNFHFAGVRKVQVTLCSKKILLIRKIQS